MMLIFDCDGVILDSMSLHTEVEAAAYGDIGIRISPEELVRRFSGVSDREVSRILEKETGVKIPDNLGGLVRDKKKAVFSERLEAMPGIYRALEALADIPRCIASGTDLDGLNHMLRVANLYEMFAPHIYSSEMVERGKPYPDLFLYAAQKVGHAPEECVVIEDGAAGVEAAVAAGMRVLGFTGGSHCGQSHGEALMKAGAENVFSSMDDLPSLMKEKG